MESKQSLQALQKRLMLLGLFNLIPHLALGLGLYGLFGAQGNAFLPALNNPQVCYALLGFGLVAEAYFMVLFIKTARARQKAEALLKKETVSL